MKNIWQGITIGCAVGAIAGYTAWVVHDAWNSWGANIVVVGYVAIVVILTLVNIVIGKRCPECKQGWALEKTGMLAKGGMFNAGREEWKCKYCGYRKWKNKQSRGIWGGGGWSDGGNGGGGGE